MQKKCKICIKNYEIIVDLKDTETAKKIWESLPITSNINVWGEEVYFYVSVSAKLENDAKDVISFGEIAVLVYRKSNCNRIWKNTTISRR